MNYRKSLVAVTALGGAMLAQVSAAAEWDTDAGIAVGGYYSDNICLARSDKEGKWVATARPDLTLRGNGARGTLSLQAAAEYNSLGDSDLECTSGQGGQFTNRESVIPSLRMTSNYEAVEDWLTLEAEAFAGRNPINPFAASGDGSFNDRNNTNITYHYGVGALLQRRLFDATNFMLRYRYNEQFNSTNQLGDSSEDRVEFDLGTDPASSRFSVGVGGRYSKVSYEENDASPAFDNELVSADVRAAFQLSRDWQMNGLVGEEWNEFTSARDDIDGSYWDAGILWTPSDRVDVAVGTGQRFFGTTPRAELNYRHKRSELNLSYSRTLTFPRNLRAGQDGFFDPEDPDFGELPGEPLPGGGLPTFLGNTPIINERLSLRYRYSTRRSSISLTGSDSRQERTEDGREATFSTYGITVSRSLSRVLSANVRLGWSQREGDTDDFGDVTGFGRDTETWRAGFGFTRRVGNDTSFNVAYQFIRQESEFALNEYDENRVTFTVRHGF